MGLGEICYEVTDLGAATSTFGETGPFVVCMSGLSIGEGGSQRRASEGQGEKEEIPAR